MISAAQIRAARALLNIRSRGLAKIASVHVADNSGGSKPQPEVRGAADTLWKFRRPWRRGVEFIPEEAGKGPGVRLRQARDSWR